MSRTSALFCALSALSAACATPTAPAEDPAATSSSTWSNPFLPPDPETGGATDTGDDTPPSDDARDDDDPCPPYAGFGDVGSEFVYRTDEGGYTMTRTTARRTSSGEVVVEFVIDGRGFRSEGTDTYRCGADGLSWVGESYVTEEDRGVWAVEISFDDPAILLPADPSADWRDDWSDHWTQTFTSASSAYLDGDWSGDEADTLRGTFVEETTVSDDLGTWSGLRVTLARDPYWGGADLLLHRAWGLVEDGDYTLVRAR